MKASCYGKQCFLHNEQFVAIDFSPPGDEKYRHCCIKCMQNKNSSSRILIYSDAQRYVQEQKKAFLYDKESQIKRNKELLRQLVTKIIAIKNEYNQAFDSLKEYINFQIMQTEQEIYDIEKKLEDIDLDSYLSRENEFAQPENDSKGLKGLVEKRLEEIQNLNLIPQCLDIVGVYDIRLIQLSPKMPIEIIQQMKEEKTDYKLGFVCPHHNQEISRFILDKHIKKENRLACVDCLFSIAETQSQIQPQQKQSSYIQISEVYKKWQDYKRQSCLFVNESLIKVTSKIESLLPILKNLKDDHHYQLTKIILELQQLKDQVQQQKAEQINKQPSSWQKLDYAQMLDIADTLSEPNLIQRISLQVDEENQLIIRSINKLIQKIPAERRLAEAQFRDQLKQIGFKTPIQIQSGIINKIINGPPNYQLVQQEKITQNEQCAVIAISNDQKTVIAGCNEKIKVFTFADGIMEPLQILSEHSSKVICLYFMKNTQSFVSGGEDDSMIIWNFNTEELWHCNQIIKSAHSNHVKQIIMNLNEDILISCSSKIKFWVKQQIWGVYQILNVHNGKIHDISLNDFQNLLVSCSECEAGIFNKNLGQVIISQLGSDKNWQTIQKIKQQTGVFKARFIGDHKIVIQKYSELILFEKCDNKLSFEQKSLIQVQFCENFIQFPIIYNKFKQLLICKLQSRIGFIKQKNNGDFPLENILHYNTWEIFGTVSNDGEYLITWDDFSKEFKIRRYL